MATIIRGDTTYFTITLTDPDTSAAYDLTDCDVWVTMKRRASDPDDRAVYMATIEIDGTGAVTASDGLSLETTAAAGVLIQRIDQAASADFRPGTYMVDVQVRDANGDVFTPLIAEDEVVTADVTHATEIA